MPSELAVGQFPRFMQILHDSGRHSNQVVSSGGPILFVQRPFFLD